MFLQSVLMGTPRRQSMKRRTVLLLAVSASSSLAGCSRLQAAPTETADRRTTTLAGPCGPVSAESIRIDSRSSESNEIRIEVRAQDGSGKTILDERRTVPAADGTSGTETAWVEGAVEEEGTYLVRASLDTGVSETYRWRVADGCDDLGIEITPEG